MMRVPMLFPGQGSQTVGMTSDLGGLGGAAGEFLAAVNDTLEYDLMSIMQQGPAPLLTETHHAQPAILAHSVGVALALRELDILPSLVAGHSIGEFSAAVAAGVMSPADGLRVVRRRGELMFAAGREIPGTMAAVLGLSGSQVSGICEKVSLEAGVVVLANHNSDSQVVISGEVEAVAAATEALKVAGARRVIPLNVSGAFHSPLLADAGRRFTDFLEEITMEDATVPLIANVSASRVQAAADLKKGFGLQLTAPVRWHETMVLLAATKPRVVLEVGPGKVLSNLAKRAFPEIKFIPVGTASDLGNIHGQLSEIHPDISGGA